MSLLTIYMYNHNLLAGNFFTGESLFMKYLYRGMEYEFIQHINIMIYALCSLAWGSHNHDICYFAYRNGDLYLKKYKIKIYNNTCRCFNFFKKQKNVLLVTRISEYSLEYPSICLFNEGFSWGFCWSEFPHCKSRHLS